MFCSPFASFLFVFSEGWLLFLKFPFQWWIPRNLWSVILVLFSILLFLCSVRNEKRLRDNVYKKCMKQGSFIIPPMNKLQPANYPIASTLSSLSRNWIYFNINGLLVENCLPYPFFLIFSYNLINSCFLNDFLLREEFSGRWSRNNLDFESRNILYIYVTVTRRLSPHSIVGLVGPEKLEKFGFTDILDRWKTYFRTKK